jgi:hypothetical protein
MLALLVAPSLVKLGELVAAPHVVTGIVLLLIGARVYRDYPALDRSEDRRPADVVHRIASGLDDRRAVLLTDLNWQVENGLNYVARRQRRDLAFARLPEVVAYAPTLIRDNAAIGREIVATARARTALDGAHGAALSSSPDVRSPVVSLADVAMRLSPGTFYAICVIRPARDATIDDAGLRGVLAGLTGGRVTSAGTDAYTAIAGQVGGAPVLLQSSNRPFREVVSIEGLRIEVRMDAWLAFDTIRRMGFGHVIAGRRHALIVERGVSLVGLDSRGQVVDTAYEGNIFAPEQRYVVTLRPAAAAVAQP